MLPKMMNSDVVVLDNRQKVLESKAVKRDRDKEVVPLDGINN